MNFKEFLLNEEIGLGDMGARIDKLFNTQMFANQAGAYVSDQFDNEKPTMLDRDLGQLWLPSTNLTIPTVERTGRITALLLKRNPIYIRLSDGTEASFTYDEYKRIEGQPAVGKVMTIMFQRHPNDASRSYSKVDKCIVRD